MMQNFKKGFNKSNRENINISMELLQYSKKRAD
jgi:hypothetical protein